VSDRIANLTERELWLGLTKFAVTLALGLLMAAFLVSIFFVHDNLISSIALNAIFIAIALSILANGFLAILKIFDWFEARKAKANG
jgi:hypothetical protein